MQFLEIFVMSSIISSESIHNLHVHLHQVFPDDGRTNACLTKVGSGVGVETALKMGVAKSWEKGVDWL